MTYSNLEQRVADLEKRVSRLNDDKNYLFESPAIRSLLEEVGKRRLRTAEVRDSSVADARKELDAVFDCAKMKWLSRKDKPGNVLRPWAEFSAHHLGERLIQECAEWSEKRGTPEGQQELIDIINLAAFLWLRNLADAAK